MRAIAATIRRIYRIRLIFCVIYENLYYFLILTDRDQTSIFVQLNPGFETMTTRPLSPTTDPLKSLMKV